MEWSGWRWMSGVDEMEWIKPIGKLLIINIVMHV
jgi:hypothetical protein